ncbi:hypothetical protein OAF54_03340 [bacterium]|nr:hypothetical protein [bacterium]
MKILLYSKFSVVSKKLFDEFDMNEFSIKKICIDNSRIRNHLKTLDINFFPTIIVVDGDKNIIKKLDTNETFGYFKFYNPETIKPTQQVLPEPPSSAPVNNRTIIDESPDESVTLALESSIAAIGGGVAHTVIDDEELLEVNKPKKPEKKKSLADIAREQEKLRTQEIDNLKRSMKR